MNATAYLEGILENTTPVCMDAGTATPTVMKLIKKNQKLHNPDSPLLIGEVKDGDVVKEVREPSYVDTQTRLF